MPTQPSWNPARNGGGWPCRLRASFRGVSQWGAAAGVLLGILALCAFGRAQAAQPSSLFSGQAPLLAITLMPIQLSTPNLGQFCPDLDYGAGEELKLGESFQFLEDFSARTESLLESNSLSSKGTEHPITLLRSRLTSPHSYSAWASLEPGLGLLFPDEEAYLSRCGGSGVLEPSFLYLKVHFRF